MPINKFIYPRMISVFRPANQINPAGGQALGQPAQLDTSGTYWGPSAEPSTSDAVPGEIPVASGVPCSIQGLGGRTNPMGEVPSDAPGPARWKVFIPFGSVAKGTIQKRDILVDDQGARYQVSVDYWNSLGWRLEAVSLEN